MLLLVCEGNISCCVFPFIFLLTKRWLVLGIPNECRKILHAFNITARMIQVADLLNSKQPFCKDRIWWGKKILPSEVHLDCGHLIIIIFLKSHCIMVFFFLVLIFQSWWRYEWKCTVFDLMAKTINWKQSTSASKPRPEKSRLMCSE